MINAIGIKRSQRVRRKLKFVNRDRFRLTIYRSSKNMTAQIIDDQKQNTLVSASTVEKKTFSKIKKVDFPNQMAELLAKRALEKNITKVFFDRGRYKYHGKVKTFAETLRKKGINF